MDGDSDLALPSTPAPSAVAPIPTSITDPTVNVHTATASTPGHTPTLGHTSAPITSPPIMLLLSPGFEADDDGGDFRNEDLLQDSFEWVDGSPPSPQLPSAAGLPPIALPHTAAAATTATDPADSPPLPLPRSSTAGLPTTALPHTTTTTTTTTTTNPTFATVVKHFGLRVMMYGHVILNSLACHLRRCEAMATSTHGPAPAATATAAAAPALTSEAEAFDPALFETTLRGKLLHSRMTGDSGVTVESFSEAGQLDRVIKECKSREKFDNWVFQLITKISQLEGGLTWNWFHLGFDQEGFLGMLCFTCNKVKAHTIKNRSNSGPFLHFIEHCKTKVVHARASAAAQRQADGLSHATPTTSRCVSE